MKAEVDASIDSNCYSAVERVIEHDDDPDETVVDRCGETATTYALLPSGVRRYLCADHAGDVDRFGDTDADHPVVVVCERCDRVTPVDHVDQSRICDDCTG